MYFVFFALGLASFVWVAIFLLLLGDTRHDGASRGGAGGDRVGAIVAVALVRRTGASRPRRRSTEPPSRLAEPRR
jgi:hypothetical protein